MGIIAIIGAVLLIVGVFATWISSDIGGSMNGWDILTNKDDVQDTIKYTYCPAIALICGIISLVLMIIPTVMNTNKYRKLNDLLGIFTLILSIVVIIVGILWYTQTIDINVIVWSTSKKLTELFEVGVGFWLVIVGAVITAIGGLMPTVKNKLLS